MMIEQTQQTSIEEILRQMYQYLNMHLPNLFKVILLGTLFWITFTVYFSAYFSVSQIYDQNKRKGLGQIAIILNYISLGLCNMVVPQLLHRFQAKRMMFVGAFGFTAFPASAIYTVHCSQNNSLFCSDSVIYINVILAAILTGLMGATLWVSQSKILTDMCNDSTRGRYFGTFWSLMQLSQITGNVVTHFIVQQVSQTNFFLILAISSLLSSLLYLFYPSTEKRTESQKFIQIDEQPTIKQTFALIFYPEVIKQLPLYTFSGLIIGFFSGFLYKVCEESIAETDDTIINQKTSAVFIVLGAAECLAGLTSGYLLDMVKSTGFMGSVSTVLVELATIFSFLAYFEKSYTLCFICAAFWGYSDCFLQNVITVLCSDARFKGQVEIFSVYRLFQAIGVLISLVLVLMLQDQQPYIMICIMGGAQIIVNQTTLSIE